MAIQTLEAPEAARVVWSAPAPATMPDRIEPSVSHEDRVAMRALFGIMIGIFVAAGLLYLSIVLFAD